MKTTLALLLTTVSALAGTLRDDANLFGPDAARVNAALVSSKVWVETLVQKPADIKSYSDTRIAQLGEGFVIIITTQPRAWRISMYPVGLAASPRVEDVGQRMATKFKAGRMADAVIVAAAELTKMTAPTPVLEAPAKPSEPMSTGAIIGIVAGGGFILLFGGMLVLFVRRSIQDKQEAERQRADMEEAGERTRRARMEEQMRESQAHEEARKERQRRERPVPKLDPAPIPELIRRRQAQDSNPYAGMTRDQRIEIVHRYEDHPSYHQSLVDDPVRLMLFMHLMNSESHHNSPAPPPPRQVHHREPEPEPEIERSTPSFRSEPSRSDESGSSGGWSSSSSDSSPSPSSDSSSAASTDSSGSGGSW